MDLSQLQIGHRGSMNSILFLLILNKVTYSESKVINNILRLPCKINTIFNHRASNIISNSEILWDGKINGLDECMEKCVSFNNCNAINTKWYALGYVNCSLLAKDSSSPYVQFVRSTGWYYYDSRPLKNRVGPYCRTLTTNPCHPCRCFDSCSRNYTCLCDTMINVTLVSKSSANQGCGPYCKDSWIYLNGENFGRNERGFNIVVLDHYSGTVEHSKSFNTHDKSTESKMMYNFLSEIIMEPKKIVLGVIRGSATARLYSKAENALQQLIGQGLPFKKNKMTYAFVGYSDQVKPDFVSHAANLPEDLVTNLSTTIPLLLEKDIKALATDKETQNGRVGVFQDP